MPRILIVDKEIDTVNQLKNKLEEHGFSVDSCFDGATALKKTYQHKPDLVILDLMKKNIEGLEVCRQIRNISNCPIIFVSDQSEEINKVEGLENGADDFVAKPFSYNELLARIKAHLRRYEIMGGLSSEIYQASELEVIPESYQVKRNGKSIELTHREFDLLLFLISNRGKVYTREKLLEIVWGFDYLGDVRTVDVTIHRLREKIENDPGKAETILTKRGFGYYFKGE